jgi:hypothetical protein
MGLPLFGQSQGPGILSRGDAPSGMAMPRINFRPFLQLNQGYQTNLSGVGLTSSGAIESRDSLSTTLGGGISGTHKWHRTQLGLDYSGSVSHYKSASSFDSFTQSFSMGLDRDLSSRTKFNFRQTAGVFTRLPGLQGLRQTVPFDLSTAYIPTTEFFDDRTIYLSSRASMTMQRSNRLSFNLGGGFLLTDHRAQGLKGTRGGTASGDFQYRLTRRATLGGMYQFSTFRYTGIYGDTFVHGMAATYSYQFSRTMEISGFFGLNRIEARFEQSVPLDPAISAIIGISSARVVSYSRALRPLWSGRLSRTFKSGVAHGSAGQGVAPGNGLFLTSYTTQFTTGYSYTGLRRWTFDVSAMYSDSKSIGNIPGGYTTTVAGAAASRQLASSLHIVARYSIRDYGSSAYSTYNRTSKSVAVGLAYSPGDIPLRLW